MKILFTGKGWIKKYWRWLRGNDRRKIELQKAKIVALVRITDELMRGPK